MRALMLLSLIFILTLTTACSSRKKSSEKKVDSVPITEVSSDDNFFDEIEGGKESAYIEGEELEDEVIVDKQMTALEEEAVTQTVKPAVELSDEFRSYQVQANDTLMLIAWKIYGDYLQWRKLAEWNPGKVGANYTISTGASLRYQVPEEQFNWRPQGDPYLVVRGDTLPRISNKVYSTYNRWREIWNNNRPLVKNPDLIFAGFTLYYIPDDRNIASEK